MKVLLHALMTFIIVTTFQNSKARHPENNKNDLLVNNISYVSFSFDTSEIIGDFWSAGSVLAKLENARFHILTKALSENSNSQPNSKTILRVGGTDADNVFWNVSAPNKPKPKFKKYNRKSSKK